MFVVATLSIFYQRWANDPFRLSRWTRLDRRRYQRGWCRSVFRNAGRLRKFPRTVRYLNAAELPVNLREQIPYCLEGDPREVHFFMPAGREAAAGVRKVGWKRIDGTVPNIVCVVRGDECRRRQPTPGSECRSEITGCSFLLVAALLIARHGTCWKLSWRAWTNRVSQNLV